MATLSNQIDQLMAKKNSSAALNQTTAKLVILDRDGVINEDSVHYVKSVDEWLPIPGSIDAISRLSKAGFTVAVATNQSGLGRGFFSLDDLEVMHAKLTDLVSEQGGEIAGIFYCPHTPEENCNCRKPKSGLIEAIEHELNISAHHAPFIGDSLRDLQCGLNKNCVPILVKTGNGAATLEKLHADPFWTGVAVFDNLAAVADYLIQHHAQ
jgi:D-glycero-D-manno-heptose 1,7-bisphosphate phosphatase